MEEGRFSYANLANVSLIEQLYHSYRQDPNSVDPSWRYFFAGMEFSHLSSPAGQGKDLPVQKIEKLIFAYRLHGHRLARFNPLETNPPSSISELELARLGFKESELSEPFPTCGFLKEESVPLSQLIEALKQTYCRTIGIEYMGSSEEIREWIQKRIEPQFPLLLSPETRMGILHWLNKAELFEAFIHTKYVGQTRFSLEGGETLIPLLYYMIEQHDSQELEEVVIGMAHRGRLNVLANILNKSYFQIFSEFEDQPSDEGSGDVKYHKGFQGIIPSATGKPISVVLAENPSHLESVNPTVEGYVRAKQERKNDNAAQNKVLPLLIHGDASVSGQGILYETLQLYRLKGYATGGTIHVVVNNQIGYTTLPEDSRSTRYCTDIALSFGAPVFHVSAENPEECIAAGIMAMQIRQKFHCDVFIDLNCYRKYGHNEGDEPTFTQPKEYQLIRKKKSIRELFKEQLIGEGLLSIEKAKQMEDEFKQSLHDTLQAVTSTPKVERELSTSSEHIELKADVPILKQESLSALTKKVCEIPEGFHIHPKLQKLLRERIAMVESGSKGVDWSLGECLAYATLLEEKIHVRLSGQDSGRGTFSHRHCIWIDQETANPYVPLAHLSKTQAQFSVYNSPLSEFGVLGFDLGYSIGYPQSLTLWEAQYGDFANGAQVIIDQYIATSEQKWSQRSNLTLLLPHGYEGKGPEHSSARIERFLQLCGEGNMIIANCTTPAQLFHILRRQAYLALKKPLVIFSPKALLRHPQCMSPLEDLTQSSFQEILDDPTPPSSPKRVILCSGKVFYDLCQERQQRKDCSTAILRVEQLYPFNQPLCQKLLDRYKMAYRYIWVQEEHKNMGAWTYIQPLLQDLLKEKGGIAYVGRSISASPAAGSYGLHKKQYEKFMEEAFKETT